MPQRGNILVAPRFNAGYEKKANIVLAAFLPFLQK